MTDRLRIIPIDWIPGYEGLYGAGSDGHIYRIDVEPPHRLVGSLNGKYRAVTLTAKCRPIPAKVHRLIARAFHERPGTLNVVQHLDGNRLNNRPENLRWTGKQTAKGAAHHSSKLTDKDVHGIRTSSESAAALAKRFGVSVTAIYNVRNGRTWKHALKKGAP